eukprot:scaffold438_cov250-Pinguiococcus_pyrenoidosus.AAC.23
MRSLLSFRAKLSMLGLLGLLASPARPWAPPGRSSWRVLRLAGLPRRSGSLRRASSGVSDAAELRGVGGAERVDLLRSLVTQKKVTALDPAVLAELFPFPLDDFQTEAAAVLARGRNVIATAPTGAGKTVIGEIAAFAALAKLGR